MIGTPGYMAPENALSAAVDHRADLYSIGCVAYYLFDRPAGVRRRDRDAGLRSNTFKPPIPVAAGAIDGAARPSTSSSWIAWPRSQRIGPRAPPSSSDASRRSMSNPGPTFTPDSGGLRRYCRLQIGRRRRHAHRGSLHQERVPRGWRLTSARPRVRTRFESPRALPEVRTPSSPSQRVLLPAFVKAAIHAFLNQR